MADKNPIRAGSSAPLGATVLNEGVNFSLYSRDAQGVELLLFDDGEALTPSRTIQIAPASNRTYHYWHVFVPGLKPGQLYAYRVKGAFDPGSGLRFDAGKTLLDPYGLGVVVPNNYDRTSASKKGAVAGAMKSVVGDSRTYDWEGDMPLQRPSSQTIVYELHVRGLTRHPSSGVSEEKRGTFAGLIEKIPYLQSLGITAVELLPVFQFDAQDGPPHLTNYWGYAPVSFFAPHQGYSSRKDPLGPLEEFRTMVKALHRAGIEVILDVVFNHTAEGPADGPTICFRGVDNRTYYILERDGATYANYSGTGNTLNANHPIVRRLIVDSLRYWVREMHVDGFRFDLASILARDGTGQVMSNPPVLWDIESDPVLAGTKMIAEAWDAAGLYQVGSFIGDAWREWNGRFRDGVREFMRGAKNSAARFADRLQGSPLIYGHKAREAEHSVNFVTCHDGFTLNDLVSYDHKHNWANGEDNRDGTNENLSWNCGVEGATLDHEVEKLRHRQVKNFLSVTLISLGMPMIMMGDEMRRTQKGNNNAYCQDNEISWVDWRLAEKHHDLQRFVRLLGSRRLAVDRGRGGLPLTLNEELQKTMIKWYGTTLNEPDWGEDAHSLALGGFLDREKLLVHLIFNAYWEPRDYELPPRPSKGTSWRRWIDTSLAAPEDIVDWESSPSISGRTYRAEGRSVVMLWAPTEE